MKIIKRLISSLEKVQIGMGVMFISLFLVTILMQIVSRVLNIAITWSEDVAKYSFVWAVFMGAAWGVSKNEHFAFTGLGDQLKGRTKVIHSIIIYGISMVFTIAMIKYGIDVSHKFWNYTWPNLPVFKMGYVWLSIPVTGITMTLYLIMHILTGISQLKEGSYDL